MSNSNIYRQTINALQIKLIKTILPIRFAYYFVRYEQLKNLSLLNCHIEKEKGGKKLAKSITNHWNKRKSACKVTRQCDISSSNVSKRVRGYNVSIMSNKKYEACYPHNFPLEKLISSLICVWYAFPYRFYTACAASPLRCRCACCNDTRDDTFSTRLVGVIYFNLGECLHTSTFIFVNWILNWFHYVETLILPSQNHCCSP